MYQEYDNQSLDQENQQYNGTGARSQENSERGFLPGFKDSISGRIFLSRLANGSPAPVHILDGLPNYLVLLRGKNGRVLSVRPHVISGFIRDGLFFTRDQVASMLRRTRTA